MEKKVPMNLLVSKKVKKVIEQLALEDKRSVSGYVGIKILQPYVEKCIEKRGD